MDCWQPLGNSHSNRGSGSAPASSLSLELGLIVSRWQRPSRQLSLEVWRGTGTARREKRANEKGPLLPLQFLPPLLHCPQSVPPLSLGLCYSRALSHRQPNTEVLLLTQLLFKQQQTIFITQVRSNHSPGHPVSIPAPRPGLKPNALPIHSDSPGLLSALGSGDRQSSFSPLFELGLLHGCQDYQGNRGDTGTAAAGPTELQGQQVS